jgi:uncharacterized protein YggE
VDSTDITVVGEGAVAAAPDVMRLQAGVEVRRRSAAEAFAEVRAAAARLTEALREAGIAGEDLRTTELSTPIRRCPPTGRRRASRP